jgi:hypothetical protein
LFRRRKKESGSLGEMVRRGAERLAEIRVSRARPKRG